ncbi:AsmA family protein [Zhouia amylolytica]|uniref:AsmA family protein n=1 Tax=Zhouia amylolytica TaxID=376730 RepID=UPI0020CFD481|nr:hypothetical protein [Zhouia amylolytica]MCQ0110282.1 hypothetical protein [Zhouia amylolytica]
MLSIRNIRSNKKVKKALFVLSGLVLFFLLGVSIVINFIITPDKLTPKILDIINSEFNTTTTIDRAELTYFSSFPNFALKLSNGTLFAKDSIANDTLLHFNTARLKLNLVGVLQKSKKAIKKIQIQEADINFSLDSMGVSNWSSLQKLPLKTSDSSGVVDKLDALYIPQITIEKSHVNYYDHSSGLQGQIDNFNLEIDPSVRRTDIDIRLKSNNDKITVYHNSLGAFTIPEISLDSKLKFSPTDTLLQIKKADLSIKDINLRSEGNIELLPQKEKIRLALKTKLTTNSLKDLLAYVPEQYLKKKGLRTRGKILMDCEINGVLSQSELPDITTDIVLDNGSVSFAGYAGEVNDIHGEIAVVVKPKEPLNSYASIKNLQIKGTGIDINGSGSIQQLLKKPIIDIDLHSALNFNTISKNFPLSESLILQGEVTSELYSNFNATDLLNFQFNEIPIKGTVKVDKLLLHSKEDSTLIEVEKIDGKAFNQANNVNQWNSFLSVKEFGVHTKNIQFSIAQLSSDFSPSKDPDLNSYRAQTKVHHLKFSAYDSIVAFSNKSEMAIVYFPKTDSAPPGINSILRADSLTLSQKKVFLTVLKGETEMKITQRDSVWEPSGTLYFDNIYAHAPEFIYHIQTPKQGISFINDNLSLNQTSISFGDSNMVVSGDIYNTKGLQTGDLVSASLQIASSYMDANQLIDVMAPMDNGAIVSLDNKVIIDTTSIAYKNRKRKFRLPEYFKFELYNNISRFQMGQMQLNGITGNVSVEKGLFKMKDMQFRNFVSDLDADLAFNTPKNEAANLDFKVYLSEIEMAHINEVVPVMDSLFPAVHSFQGKVDFRIKGNVELNEELKFKLKTVRGVAAMKATDIFVVNDPAFKDLANTFKFKHKQKNPIETLEMQMAFKDHGVDILPALIEIDKYKLVLGGTQQHDMSYHYHISVLKSPIPFKTGVDITGENFKDHHIKLSKAKYKYYFTDKERLQKKADSSIVNERLAILKTLDF